MTAPRRSSADRGRRLALADASIAPMPVHLITMSSRYPAQVRTVVVLMQPPENRGGEPQ